MTAQVHTGPAASRQLAWRIGGAVLACAVLGGVFLLYARPEFMVDLAQQLWACF